VIAMKPKAARRLYRVVLFLVAAFCLVWAVGEWCVGIPFNRFYFPDQRSWNEEMLSVTLPLLASLLSVGEASCLLLYRRLQRDA
jgi:hypothetical protein